jgi:putative nucleotidyltransferase with HDIG domain
MNTEPTQTAAAPRVADLAELHDQLHAAQQTIEQLQVQEMDFVQSELQHLRELAILNRVSDALAARRGLEQIAQDALRELTEIIPSQVVSLVEPDVTGQPARLHQVGLPPSLTAAIEDHWGRLLQTAFASPQQSSQQASVNGPAGTLDVALPVVSGEHVMGVFLVEGIASELMGDAPRLRLVQSLLRHTAIALENGVLFESISRLIVNTVVTMALAIESRDAYTGGHVLRVTAYSLILARHLGLSPEQLAIVKLGGLLHDIGKVAVPDHILHKPGRLDPEELLVMQSHAARGDDILRPLPPFDRARSIVRHHHERFDGKGYPDGLAGEAIPMLARVTAIADTFDAMTSDRPYRKALAPEIGFKEVAAMSGTQFDPAMAAQFVRITWDQLQEEVEHVKSWVRSEHRQDMPELLRLFTIDRPHYVPGEKT